MVGATAVLARPPAELAHGRDERRVGASAPFEIGAERRERTVDLIEQRVVTAALARMRVEPAQAHEDHAHAGLPADNSFAAMAN